MSLVLLSICMLIICIHFGYYFAFNFFNFAKPQKITNTQTPVSVIICAKNKAEDLKKLLPTLINQEYDNYELVLINDRSFDETSDILETYENQYKFIKVVTVNESEYFYGNKKYALTLGIKAASNDCLLFTEPDCEPKSKYWIQSMANAYTNPIKIVLGYNTYEIKNSLLNKLIRYDNLATSLKFLSFAKIKNPYMGTGKNLMYSKTLFLKNKGFHQHIRVMYGEDDLLINQISNHKNTEISYQENAHTVSKTNIHFKNWMLKKKKEIATASLYKPKHKFLLGLFTLNKIFFWIFFPITLIYTNNLLFQYIIAITVAIKFLSEYIVIGIAAKKLNEKGLVFLIPILDLICSFFQLYQIIHNKVYKPKIWS